MTSIQKPIFLVYLMLHIFCAYSQKNTIISESDSIISRELEIELNRKGGDLIRDGLYLQALDTLNLSLQLRIKNHGEVHYFLGRTYLNIGIAYRNLGQYQQALKYFTIAEQNYLSDTTKYKSTTKAILYSNFGNTYRDMLDYNMALQYFNQNLSLYKNDSVFTSQHIAKINYKIAEIYYSINDYNKALDLINANIENADIDDEIFYYELLAFIHQVKENYAEARKSYKKIINLTIYNSDEDNDINVARQYLNYSLFLLEIDYYQEASEIMEQAGDIIKLSQAEQGQDLADYYNLKGYYYVNVPIEEKNVESFSYQKRQNLLEAINWYSMALRALGFPESYSLEDIEDSDNWLSIIDCINFLKKIADTNNKIAINIKNKDTRSYVEYLSKAIYNYQFAASLVQKARKQLSSDDSKITLTGMELSTFQELLATAYNAYAITKDSSYIEIGFQSTERTKSSSVFDKLSNEIAMDNSLIPDSLVQLEKQLLKNISLYQEKLYEENKSTNPDTSITAFYNDTILKTNVKHKELLKNLETNYSDYYELKYSESMLSISDIQEALKEDEVILEYMLYEGETNFELYTFVISKTGVKFNRQKIDQDFISAIESTYDFMSSSNYVYTTNEDSKNFCISSHKLYNVLIDPFYDEIVGKKLTIVPDGILNYIAFDALIEELPDTNNPIRLNQLKYLIRNYTINYSYSSNLLFKLEHSGKKIRNKVVAFAPEYSKDTIEIANRAHILYPLPGVQKEVDEISKMVNTLVFRGNNASEENFRKNIKYFDILHLAMHAIINDSLPSFSWLAFAQDTSINLNSDGKINTLDIYNLKINASLTVLSACNTGGGQLKKGEGLMSLARGFFYAGCPSVIMSLWEVEDLSGSQLMSSFYKNLKKGKTKDAALRLAKLEYLENSNSRRAHPHYWSGYISLGNNSALYKSYDFYFFIFLILLVIGIFTDQVYRIKKARKKRAF